MSDHHSTGPRTPEGKARSSMNALKHGLTARDVILHDHEDREDFAALQTDLTAELNPTGVLETLLLNRLLRASWDLRRIERIEVESADRRDPAMEKLQLSLERYKMRAERSFYRALHEIQALQVERRAPRKGQSPDRGRGRRPSSFGQIHQRRLGRPRDRHLRALFRPPPAPRRRQFLPG